VAQHIPIASLYILQSLGKSRDILDQCETHSVERKNSFVEVFRFFKDTPRNFYWYIKRKWFATRYTSLS